MLRNLASALMLTEFDFEADAARRGKAAPDNLPKLKGRIVTTITKAKEVRPLVEKCITIARDALVQKEEADKLGPPELRQTEQTWHEWRHSTGWDAWKNWRKSKKWNDWNQAMAPVVNARRRCLRLLGDKRAVRALFENIAPRFADRNGGYTRILRLAKPRLGDAGTRAILEFVGVRDRTRTAKAESPSFEGASAGEKAS
jgi:large subunit ribosomal protein L17